MQRLRLPTTPSLTVKDLKDDEVAFDIGFWKLTPYIHKRKVICYIVENPVKGGYTLALYDPDVEVIGTAKTLSGIVNRYNNFVSAANTHDLTVVLGHPTGNSIVIRK